jgi:Group II intron, maturase-specific domain
MYNPCIRGWINYYSHFYPTQLRPTLKRIDAYVRAGLANLNRSISGVSA